MLIYEPQKSALKTRIKRWDGVASWFVVAFEGGWKGHLDSAWSMPESWHWLRAARFMSGREFGDTST